MYIIKKIWIDPLENRNTYGYDIYGYVTTKEEALRICGSRWIPIADYPWPLDYYEPKSKILDGCVPMFIYTDMKGRHRCLDGVDTTGITF